MSRELLVTADLLAIPDGMDGDKLMLTVQVMPHNDPNLVAPHNEPEFGTIPLPDWPEVIAGLAERMRVTVANLDGSAPTYYFGGSELTNFLAGPHPRGGGSSRRHAATQLWQRIFQPQPGFEVLLQAISKQGNETSLARRDVQSNALVEPKFTTSRTSDLAVLLGAIEEALTLAVPGSDGVDENGRLRLLNALFSQNDRASPEGLAKGPGSKGGDIFAEHAAELRAVEGLADQVRETYATSKSALAEFVGLSAWRAVLAELDAALEPDDPEFPDDMEPPVEPEISPIDVAKRKLGAITSIPTLAHYFCLAIQLTLNQETLGGRGIGKLRVEFVDEKGDPQPGQLSSWTAFVFRPNDNHLFGVLDDPGSPDPGQYPYKDGLLCLSASVHGVDRYRVDSRDVVNTLQRLRLALERMRRRPEAEWPGLATLRRGIALFDRFSKPAMVQTYWREQQLEARAGGDETPLYVRDLVVGIRPDVAIAEHPEESLNVDMGRWKALTYRRVTCKDNIGNLLDETFYKEPAIRRIAHHDHGFAVVPEYYKPSSDEPGLVGKEEELFTWVGESIALAPGDPDGVEVNPADDLGISIDYDFLFDDDGNPEKEGLLPPLRETFGYVFGARLVYPNGVSRRFPEATCAYAAKAEFLIGNEYGHPYRFMPPELPPPQIHLRPGDPLVRTHPTGMANVAGESIARLVVRDTESQTRPTTTRLMLPPRISFDRAESEGQFDAVTESIPAGAVTGKVHVQTFVSKKSQEENRFCESYWTEGVFPEARLGSIWHVLGAPDDAAPGQWINVETGEGKPNPFPLQAYQSRGTVARLFDKSPSGNGLFYASRNGRTVVATLLPGVPTNAALKRKEIDFWRADQLPKDALPIVIELVRSAQPGARLSAAPFQQVAVGEIKLPHLRVDLGPGETFELELKAQAEVPSVQSAKLTLIHALQKPSKLPAFAPPPVPPIGELGINCVTVTTGDAKPKPDRHSPALPPLVKGPGGSTLPTWEEVVKRLSAQGNDMLDWPSSEGGSITFFTGRILIDRKSTGRLRCEATWKDFGPKSVTRSNDREWVNRTPERRDTLFNFDVEAEGDGAWVNLLHNEDGGLRSLSYSFPDGRARRLKMELIATSRFASYFQGDCDKTSNPIEVWTECTFRAPLPQVDRIVPMFDWDVQERSSRRDANRLRIYLDEGWYASGEGERLAIVLKPGDVIAPTAFEPFLSRTGADPIRPGGKERSYLEAAHFPGASIETGLQLYLNDDSHEAIRIRQGDLPSSSQVALPVDIVPLNLQSEEGALFCEVTIAPGGAYTPFVQLGLVRYQEHAVAHLRLSPPIQYQSQLLPWREIAIAKSNHGNVIFKMRGPGYRSVVDQTVSTATTLDLRLVQWDEDFKEWVASPTDHPTIHIQLKPALGTDNHFYWEQEIKLPYATETQQVALLVEEFEHLPTEVGTGEIEGGLMAFVPSMTERLVFSHLQRIPRP